MSSKTYYVASYCRFSSREDDVKESNSIQSQRDILKDFIDELNKKYPSDTFIHTNNYSDDDYSGTNFDRPSFQQLKADCLSGKINCIVVKDHSRFARSAARMQILLEEDLENVRYISKSEDFDSKFDEYDSMFQLRNTFNEMYAEDISKKVHSSIDNKQARGLFIGSFCCYGYVKSEEDKHKLVIDENVRYVVEMIFDLRLKGMNLQTIARHLNSLNIPSPSAYKRMQGLKYKNHYVEKFNDPETQLWTYSTLHRLLTNQTYKGNLTQGRVRQKMRKAAKVKDKADWVIAQNACPAIVDTETFDEVQRLMKESKHIKANPIKHPFAGLIKCGECHHSMIKAQKTRSETLYYACRTRKAQGKQYCDNDYIRADVLEKIILDDLNDIISEIKDLNSLIDTDEIDSHKLNLEKQLNNTKVELERVVRKRRLSYSDYQDDLLSKSDYIHLKEESEKREVILSEQIEKLQLKISEYNITDNQNTFIQRLLNFKRIEKLDRDILQEMIECIYIYKDNRIKIVYKFANELEALKETITQYVAS